MKWKVFLRFLFALSFLFSAYTKFIAPGYFEIVLLDQGIVHTRQNAAYFGRLFIGLEFSLGLLLLFPFYNRKLLLLAIALLGGFSLHLSYLLWIGNSENCGCFGEMISLTPDESLLKNALLLALAFWIYPKREKGEKAQPMVFIFIPLIISGIWLMLPLPTADSQQFNAFTHFEGKGRVDLLNGETLVAVFNLDCEHCQEVATALGKLYREQQIPPLYVLYYQEGTTTVAEFQALTYTNFPHRFIETNTFFDLIGSSPPRLYYLANGRIEHFWDSEIVEGLKERFPSR